MQMKRRTKQRHFLLCMAMAAAVTLLTTGCNGRADTETPSASAAKTPAPAEDCIILGEGGTEFQFIAADTEGSETQFTIHTDKETVGEALLELGLIEGTEGAYGLYVNTVNGITLDYNKDGLYWAFYVNGEYAQSGVDSTAITEGGTYSFQAE